MKGRSHRCRSTPTGPTAETIGPGRRESHTVAPGPGHALGLALFRRPTSLQVRLRTPPCRSLVSREEVPPVIGEKGAPSAAPRPVSSRAGVVDKPVSILETGGDSPKDGRRLKHKI